MTEVKTPLFDPRLSILNQDALRKARDVAKDGFENEVLPRQVVDEAILTYVEALPKAKPSTLVDELIRAIGDPEAVARAREALDQAVAELGGEAAQLLETFKLRYDADMRSIKRWQEAHPGNDLVWPDHADLVVWLLEQRPGIIENSAGGFVEFVTEDVPVLTGQMIAANVEPLIRMTPRGEVIGYRIYKEASKP